MDDMTGVSGPGTGDYEGLFLQLLGPIAARRAGTAVELGHARQRAVLAVLALEPGKLVNRSTIIDAVWHDDPPRSAANLIQTYVSRLRRVLSPGRPTSYSAPLLASEGQSYRLRVTSDQLDLLRFRELTAGGRSAWSEGSLDAAATFFRRALELWHGDPLADLSALRGYPLVIGLADEWVTSVMDYADVCAALGTSDHALVDLRAAAARHPLDERLHSRLMVALDMTGQRPAALRLFDSVRDRLDNELGICPGPELSASYTRVLHGAAHPAVIGPRAAERQAVVPRQLPRAIPGFVGRAEQLRCLSAALDQADRQGRSRPILVISGTAGVGKTTLAVRWAHSVTDRFPDGQIHLDLHGFTPSGAPATPGQVIRRLLEMLQLPIEQVPAGLDAQLDLYHRLLAGKRMLIVLDNARDPEQIRALLPAGPGCLILVTSRDSLLGLAVSHGARLLTLDVFTDTEAEEFIAAGMGPRPGPDEASVTAEIIRLCDRLPLALAIVVARAHAHRDWPLAALSSDLRGAPVRLDALDAGDVTVNVRSVFSWSYRELTQAAARGFRLLGLLSGPDISLPAVASLAGLSLPHSRRLTGELTRVHMITEHVPQRFAMHDLLRAYAADELRDHEDDAERLAATRRVLDYYLHTAHSAALAINPARDALELAPASAGVVPERIRERAQANEWFRAEYQVLLKAIELAVESGFESHAWQIPWTLVNFFDHQGYWQDWVATGQIAISASQRSDNMPGLAISHQNISIVYVHLRRYEDAQAHLQRAITLNRNLGIRAGHARCLLDIARTFEALGRYHDALEHASTALSLYRELGHEFGQARALNAIAWSSAHLGDARHAITSGKLALDIHAKLGNRMGQAATLDSLGYAHDQLGQHADAVCCYQQALDLLGRGERTYQVACVLINLATSYQAVRRSEAAARASREALSILRALRHPDIDQTTSRLSDAGIAVRTLVVSAHDD
jgi:DNA-binding SARP family transcriptional activator/tetratricopeptide (TPR) repeat protein